MEPRKFLNQTGAVLAKTLLGSFLVLLISSCGGLSDGELRVWRGVGFENFGELQEWRATGLGPNDSAGWRKTGFDSGRAFWRKESGFDPREAKKWEVSGLGKSGQGTAGIIENAGLTEQAGKKWIESGIRKLKRRGWFRYSGLLEKQREDDRKEWEFYGERALAEAQWKRAGFGPSEVRAWTNTEIGNVLEVQKWKAAGIPPKEAQAWYKNAFLPTAAGVWRNAGLTPGEARRWRSAGFPPGEAIEMKKAQYSVEEAIEWREVGVTNQAEVREWKAAGFSPTNAFEWIHAGFRSKEAKAWKEAGLSIQEAQRWKGQGLNPNEARKTLGIAEPYDSRRQRRIETNCPSGIRTVAELIGSSPYNVRGKCFEFSGTLSQLLNRKTAIFTTNRGLNRERTCYLRFAAKFVPNVPLFRGYVKGEGTIGYTTVSGTRMTIPKLKVISID